MNLIKHARKYNSVLFSILLLFTSVGCHGEPTPALNPEPKTVYLKTTECKPCKLPIAPELPQFSFTFNTNTIQNTKSISSINVSIPPASNTTQILNVSKMEPIYDDDEFLIIAEDINNDGYNDLALTTSYGITNKYIDYWIFDNKNNKFSFIGNYPILSINKQNNTISSYEAHGDGGMIFTSTNYSFIKEKLTVTSQEIQTKNGFNNYTNSKYILQNGQLQLKSQQTITYHKD